MARICATAVSQAQAEHYLKARGFQPTAILTFGHQFIRSGSNNTNHDEPNKSEFADILKTDGGYQITRGYWR